MTTPRMHTTPTPAPATRPNPRPVWLLLGLACWVGAAPTSAAPVTPASDAEIVERLPYRLGPQERRQRRELAQTPANLPLALTTAREAIERARRFGDPREIGTAQAALAPWWGLPEPPPPVRLLRAIVQQNQHGFDAALADLDALLRPAGNAPLAVQAQAELTRSSVLQVLGRLADAQAGCERLAGARYESLGPGVRTTAQACIAELMSLQGRSREAAAAFARLAAETAGGRGGTGAPPGWLALLRAEFAERQGDDAAAEANYRLAVQGAPDVYARAAFADWLLDRGRAVDVLRLIGPEGEAADVLLLRRAIALQRTGDPAAPAAVAALQERFEAAGQRGSGSLHAREEAVYRLVLRNDAAGALQLAQAHWSVQHEPADAVLLLRAARAAGQLQAAEPVRAFQRATGLEDVRLADAATQPLPAARPAPPRR